MNVSRFTFNMFGVNTYILWDNISKEAMIIDPGMVNDNERKIVDSFIEENGLNMRYLVNTHMHIDHSFGISYMIQKYGLKLACNIADQFLAERLMEQARMFGLPMSISELEINMEFNDGDKLSIGGEILNVMHVPGHSPGSIVIYAPESSFLISGDVLFDSSIGRTDLPGGNYKQLVDAIREKLMTLPDDTIVYPGHGLETTIGKEKISNPYL